MKRHVLLGQENVEFFHIPSVYLLLTAPLISGDPLPGDQRQTEGAALHGLKNKRLVLEKTPLTLDRLFLRGVQSGVGTITNVVYHEPTGVATVTTMNPHNFNVGDPITMSGIAFTCSGSTGITTTIFPDPQQSYVVDEITNTVGTSRTFSAVIGRSKGYPHFYNPAIHYIF